MSIFTTYFFAVSAMAIWGISFIWMKILLESFSPLSVIFFRLSLSAIILFIILSIKNNEEIIHKSDYKYFFWMAFFEPFCYSIGEVFGLNYISASLASILISLIPVITPIFMFFIYKERLTKMNIIGIILSFFGVTIIVINGSKPTGTILGISLMSFAILSAIIYGFIVKHLSSKYSGLLIVRTQNTIAATLFLPLFLIFDFSKIQISDFTISTLTFFFLLSFLCSSLSYIIFTETIKRIGLSKANLLTNLIPVFTTIFAVILISEKISLIKLTGIVIVLIGIYYSQKKRRLI
jgi:drug/metabolite transporter (DMT)-like permease